MDQLPEEKPRNEKEHEQEPRPGFRWDSPQVWIILVLGSIAVAMFVMAQQTRPSVIRFDFFLEQLRDGNVAEIKKVGEDQIYGVFHVRPEAPPEYDGKGVLKPQKKDSEGRPERLAQQFYVVVDPSLSEETRKELESLYGKHHVHVSAEKVSDSSLLYILLVGVVLPLLMLGALWFMFRRTRDQLLGGGFLSGFTKSTAKKYESVARPITFKDVAGLDGVKADLQEIVEYLKNPEKFQRLGGRVPKGVLLNGPPGTGKTLLARAVAGEAGVPFYSVSGSEFIQMFVGVGASRVRDLFQNAKDTAPAIIFIDEIDAVGRQRGAGLGGGHDEREQTLNQILSEMDGFSQTESVIVVAATNRPDVLDPALLRPGRFDRHITVDRPTKKGREEIFKVHVRDVPLADDVALSRLAAATVGLTGADIRNIVNEAALWAARQDKNRVDMSDFEYARDKVLMGPKREEAVLGKEKEKTAYHEAGHALLAWVLPAASRVHKVTVIPRGRMLGATQMLPVEEKLSTSESEILDHLVSLLGGRAAEKLIYGEYTVGAQRDLEQATALARRMVTQWGMSERLGPVSYKLSDEDPFLGRELHHGRAFSEHTLQVIDQEVSNILHGASERAYQLLSENREKLEQLVEALLEREELSEPEIADLIGPSAHDVAESNGRADRSVAARDTAGKSER
jgi:cell division protease FtsH